MGWILRVRNTVVPFGWKRVRRERGLRTRALQSKLRTVAFMLSCLTTIIKASHISPWTSTSVGWTPASVIGPGSPWQDSTITNRGGGSPLSHPNPNPALFRPRINRHRPFENLQAFVCFAEAPPQLYGRVAYPNLFLVFGRAPTYQQSRPHVCTTIMKATRQLIQSQ